MFSNLLVLAMSAAPQASTPPPPAYDQAAYRRCVDSLQARAGREGIGSALFDRHVRTVVPDTSVLRLLDSQPEFKTPIWDYLAGLVDEERVADGRQMLQRYADVLSRVEAAYGVDPATVVAVWGVESDFGDTFGKRPLLQSLTTLSCMGRRQDFFRGELLATLRIIRDGDVTADKLVGSWAGAFGHTQFIPSTYRRLAVDFDGDGRRDLVDSIPDALASTANYLKRAGWRTGEPWGYEVSVPARFSGAHGRTRRQPLSHWVGQGITRVDGSPIAPDGRRSALVMPAGRDGPAFLVFRNFDAIYSYNAAESYAFAIALLSERLRGRPGLVRDWPTDDPGLSRLQRRELQQLLLDRGHDIGEIDGIVGGNTRAAIVLEQQRLGRPPDGRASQGLLRALKVTRPVPVAPAEPRTR